MSEQPVENKVTDDTKAEAHIDLPKVYTEIARDNELRENVFSMLESLDKTKFMAITREVWNKVPATFQNVMLRMPSLLPQIGLLKGFARCGLLTPKDPDLSIEDISKTDEVMQKIALWLAKKLVPAMAEFDKTVNPALQKLGFEKGFDGFVELQKSLSTDFYENMRTRLNISRLQQDVENEAQAVSTTPSGAAMEYYNLPGWGTFYKSRQSQQNDNQSPSSQLTAYELPHWGTWYRPKPANDNAASDDSSQPFAEVA